MRDAQLVMRLPFDFRALRALWFSQLENQVNVAELVVAVPLFGSFLVSLGKDLAIEQAL